MTAAARSVVERVVEVPGHGEVPVRDVPGPEGAPVVLLLHGLGATARLNWGPSFRPLSRHFRVLGIDHRGHGRGLRTHRFELEECADDAVAAARALGVEHFIAVGYSMGGPIASLTWRRHPGNVSGLVLCATSRHFASRTAARIARATFPAAVGLARRLPGVVNRRLLQRWLARIEHPRLRERLHTELAGHEPASVLQAAEALTRFSSHDWIGDVDVPVSVVVTTRDEMVPPTRQRKLAASIPGAETFEVDGDHDACVMPGEFVPALVEACRSVARRADASPGALTG